MSNKKVKKVNQGSFLKICLFLSSYFPLFIFLEIKLFKVDSWNSFLNDLWYVHLVILIFTILGIIGVSKVCIEKNFKPSTNSDMKHVPSQNLASENLTYIMTYIIPLLTDLNDMKSLLINLILFMIIGYIYIKENLIYMNVVLSLFGYSIYKNEISNFLISKNTKNELILNKENLEYVEIEENVYIVRVCKN